MNLDPTLICNVSKLGPLDVRALSRHDAWTTAQRIADSDIETPHCLLGIDQCELVEARALLFANYR